jgi:hypothetical protein
VAYDVLAESRRLIADGLPDRPVRLSRRRRFAPVAVDVDGDVACTRFVRRGVGCFWDETHLLVYDNGWTVLGGSASSGNQRWSTDEFERARDELPFGHLRTEGGGAVRDDTHRRLLRGGRWLRAAELLVSRSVTEVLVDGRRRLTVPDHGHLVVVWATRRAPRVSVRDAAGHELANAALHGAF